MAAVIIALCCAAAGYALGMIVGVIGTVDKLEDAVCHGDPRIHHDEETGEMWVMTKEGKVVL